MQQLLRHYHLGTAPPSLPHTSQDRVKGSGVAHARLQLNQTQTVPTPATRPALLAHPAPPRREKRLLHLQKVEGG